MSLFRLEKFPTFLQRFFAPSPSLHVDVHFFLYSLPFFLLGPIPGTFALLETVGASFSPSKALIVFQNALLYSVAFLSLSPFYSGGFFRFFFGLFDSVRRRHNTIIFPLSATARKLEFFKFFPARPVAFVLSPR